jgi:type I restriction enzyme S subunit
VLRATDIDDEGHVVGDGAARLIPGGKLLEKQLKHGDILLEGSGGGPDKPVGRVALFEAGVSVDPTICSNFFKTLRPNRTIVNERFLWRKLGWFYRQPKLLALQQQTTGIINLNFAEYLEAEIDVPTNLPEQAKIAEVLDALDATIRQTESIIEKLKQVKLGLLHDLFTRGVDANGELRPPQGESPDLYKGSPLGWIPRAWTTAKLVEIADIRSGANAITKCCSSLLSRRRNTVGENT